MKASITRRRSVREGKTAKSAAARKLVGRLGTAELPPSLLRIKRILVPLDFSRPSTQALKFALKLAERFGATLWLLHVIERASFINDVENVALAVPDEKVENIAKKQLISLSKRIVKSPVPVFPYTRVGKPFVEIAALAQTQNIDLIVLATHGYTGLKHALMGSTAERVVQHAPCPVLVVRGRQVQSISRTFNWKG